MWSWSAKVHHPDAGMSSADHWLPNQTVSPPITTVKLVFVEQGLKVYGKVLQKDDKMYVRGREEMAVKISNSKAVCQTAVITDHHQVPCQQVLTVMLLRRS